MEIINFPCSHSYYHHDLGIAMSRYVADFAI